MNNKKRPRRPPTVKVVDGLVTVVDEFMQGYACACATLARYGDRCDALELLVQGGYDDKQKLKAGGVDDYDLEALFPEKK